MSKSSDKFEQVTRAAEHIKHEGGEPRIYARAATKIPASAYPTTAGEISCDPD